MAEWNFAEDKPKVAAEIHLAGSDQRDENGLVVKEILREGEWPVIPTNFGRVNQPLRVVRSGKSNQDAGVISMEELVANFDANAIPNVQIPLSDDQHDHKNTTRLNTGFVRGLRIEDKDDGARLVAEMEFTEPEVRERVLRGTYADVSCGIPWEVASRGSNYGASLEHVAITNKPFIDSLGPFLAMSAEDKNDLQVDLFSQTMEVTEDGDENKNGQVASGSITADKILAGTVTEKTLTGSNGTAPEKKVVPADLNVVIQPETPTVSYETQKALFATSLNSNFNLAGTDNTYLVKDLNGKSGVVQNTVSGTTWSVPYTIMGTATDPSIHLSGTGYWEPTQGEESDEAPAEQKPTVPRRESIEDELQAARRLREIRLSDSSINTTQEATMATFSNEELERLELSDEIRAALTDVLSENADLKARSRVAEVDARIDELKELGLKERPSALKLYRDVMLSDDGGPAVILLSDEGKEKKQLSAVEILDQFIEAVKGSDEKVVLSDQALVTGDDDKPPADASGETAPLEDRVSKMKAELGIK